MGVLFYFRISQNVARWIGRPRNTNCTYLIGDIDLVKVNMIFEDMLADMLDLRFAGYKQIIGQTHIAIPDIFGGKRKQYLLFGGFTGLSQFKQILIPLIILFS